MAHPGSDGNGDETFDFNFADHDLPALNQLTFSNPTLNLPSSANANDQSLALGKSLSLKELDTGMTQGVPRSPVCVNPSSEDFPARELTVHVYDIRKPSSPSPYPIAFPHLGAPIPTTVDELNANPPVSTTHDGHADAPLQPSEPNRNPMPFRPRNPSLTVEDYTRVGNEIVSPLRDRATASPGPLQASDAERSRQSSYGSVEQGMRGTAKLHQPLQYHHSPFVDINEPPKSDRRDSRPNLLSSRSGSPSSSTAGEVILPSRRHLHATGSSPQAGASIRPSSAYSALSLSDPARGRLSPGNATPSPQYRRISSAHSAENRPVSYIDLLNVPYPQPAPASGAFNNSDLRTQVGINASLLSHSKTLEMYRANAKKTNDPSIQYEFAVFMISAAQQVAERAASFGNGNLDGTIDEPMPSTRDLDSPFVDNSTPGTDQKELLKEARQILQKLSDRSYPFAQYYLADGYTSGLFSNGKVDYDRAFPLFVSAGKHGHAEASYRAALCYEYGWGCRRDPAKAVQFYRQSASKKHPGAMLRLGKACLLGDMGLGNRYREGVKWLKRATESADFQYNSAPYELGLLHETGYGDDVFQDETYAAQLFTQAGDLGHPEANFRLGDAYEHGKLNCPRDPALSVHFYNGGAQAGHPRAMMALCAWYIVGAEPVLEKDESEAYEWARRAAELGLPKAEYAVGYFTEMGIGCRRDPLEANVWYVKAADEGDERAKNRLAAIRAAASGEVLMPPSNGTSEVKGVKARKSSTVTSDSNKLEKDKDSKDCIVM